jgi:zinc transport system substrate-binding protein
VDQEAKESSFDVAAVTPLVEHEGVELEAEGGAAQTSAEDPHVWLDPTRLATIATALADRLATADPAGASAYRDRARDLGTRLQALDKEYTDGLKNCQRRDIVTSHAAFGYLADRYGLHQIPVTGLTPEVEPTPGHLAAAAEAARKAGATTIFFETLVSPKVAQAVADAVGAKTAVLDPIEGLEPGSTDDYLSVMRSNLVTLRSALGCT